MKIRVGQWVKLTGAKPRDSAGRVIENIMGNCVVRFPTHTIPCLESELVLVKKRRDEDDD